MGSIVLIVGYYSSDEFFFVVFIGAYQADEMYVRILVSVGFIIHVCRCNLEYFRFFGMRSNLLEFVYTGIVSVIVGRNVRLDWIQGLV